MQKYEKMQRTFCGKALLLSNLQSKFLIRLGPFQKILLNMLEGIVMMAIRGMQALLPGWVVWEVPNNLTLF